MINLDFADVKMIMESSGTALIGLGEASGEQRPAFLVSVVDGLTVVDGGGQGLTGQTGSASGQPGTDTHQK